MATFIDSNGGQTMVSGIATQVKSALAKYLPLTGGTVTGAVVFDNGGTIDSTSGNLDLIPADGDSYVRFGANNACTVDVDGYVTAPTITIKDPINSPTTNEGKFIVYYNNKEYVLDIAAAINAGLFKEK